MKFLQHEDFRKYPVIAENMPKLLQINFVTKLFGATLYLEHSWEKIKGEVRHIFILSNFCQIVWLEINFREHIFGKFIFLETKCYYVCQIVNASGVG